MSRRSTTTIWRSLTVWLTVTAATAAGAAATPAAWQRAGSGQFPDLLVGACTAALVLALTWIWVVTTITVVELLAGRLRAGGGTTRRLVLMACGVAALAGTTAPAMAADDSSILAGLSLPDRSVTSSEVRHREAPAERAPRSVATRATRQPRVHVVRPGESLWSIAAATWGSGGTDERWRAIWAANRDVIGDDPDLILPGQVLRLPDPIQPDEGER